VNSAPSSLNHSKRRIGKSSNYTKIQATECQKNVVNLWMSNRSGD
jgi:hypothetical protein